MAVKKSKKELKKETKNNATNEAEEAQKKAEEEMLSKLSPEARKKLEDIKKKMEKFKTDVLKKFDKYVLGISILPPPKKDAKDEHGQPLDPDKIEIIVLVDDNDSKKMPKHELKEKTGSIIAKMGKDIDKKIDVQTVLISEVWQSCFDGKYDLPQLIGLSAPVYDTGMLGALKITELHKNMTLKKFEKYIVSYVFFGSLTRGEATAESDVDVCIIVDDTDVKKMSRAELKDKLRAIILGMGAEAGDMTGIKNKLNIQVYIMTDFWEWIKDANPVMFTILRDGVPLYDRGMFMPWKQLLRMGKIKPSTEAIDMFMSSGEQMIGRVKARLKSIIEADVYWSTLTPAQAALMLYGLQPPTPKETINLLEEVFVKKENLLEPEYVEIMREIRKYYKDLEHGTLKEVSGKQVDDLIGKAERFLKRLKKLFSEIEIMKEKESMLHAYDSVVTVVRDVLLAEGVERASDGEILNLFESEMVHVGKMPEKYRRLLRDIEKGKELYESEKLTKTDVAGIKKKSKELIKYLVEHLQRKRGKELERARIRVKYGDKYGEVFILGDKAFITHDLDAEQKKISSAVVTELGGLGTIKDSSIEEFENALSDIVIPPKVFIREKIFDDLKRVFGRDVEVLLSY